MLDLAEGILNEFAEASNRGHEYFKSQECYRFFRLKCPVGEPWASIRSLLEQGVSARRIEKITGITRQRICRFAHENSLSVGIKGAASGAIRYVQGG